MTFLKVFTLCVLFQLFVPHATHAAESGCPPTDRACLFTFLEKTADSIEEKRWRDAQYRELAKLLAANGQTGQAIALISKVESPDTKAMTIRGIGMAAAEWENVTTEEYSALFTTLHEEAAKITHPPSHGIALTYIAMGQAFAGDNDGAMETAKAMQNDALRNKAFGETAEIQAGRGDLENARASIAEIDDPAFRSKAWRLVSKILTDNKEYEKALRAAESIESPYRRAEALLHLLSVQMMPPAEEEPAQ